jgi:hypothetical protein
MLAPMLADPRRHYRSEFAMRNNEAQPWNRSNG